MDINLPPNLSPTKAGTAGGTLLIVLLQLPTGELLRTALLAAVGATASFVVSVVLKQAMRWWRKD